jgi:hypothetical protein
VDEGAWTSYSGSVVLSSTGTHVIEFYATDRAGNTEEANGAEIVILAGSTATPAIVFQTHDGSYSEGNVTIAFAVNNMAAISKLEYSLDGGAFVMIEPSATSVAFTALTDGEHSVKVRATDASNNTIESAQTFTIGAEDPDGGPILDPIVIAALVAGAIVAVGGIAWYARRKK